MKQILSLLSILILALALPSCEAQGSGQSKGKGVATTIAPVASLMAELLGSGTDILVLLPQGATPETYEPTAQDLMALSACRAYVCMGDLGFERQWLSRLSELAPQLEIANVGDLLLQQDCAHSHSTEAGQAMDEHHHHAHDPHYWTSIRGLRAIASATADMALRLELVSPDTLQARRLALEERITQLSAEVDSALSHAQSTAFVIYHPSLTDFADEHGLTQLVIEQEGKEPSSAQLASLIQEARRRGVRVVFTQKEFGTRLCQSVAEEIGAQMVEIDPLSEDWQGQIRAIVTALAR